MKIAKSLTLAIGIIFLVNIACVYNHSPSLNLPKPTGPFDVGTINYYFVDKGRPETFTPESDDFREVAIRIWYPAEAPLKGTPVPYIENAEERKDNLPENSPLPPSFFDKIAGVKSNSYKCAKMAGEKTQYPILLFSHAYWAGMNQITVLMEELASHGYIAVSVGHAYETSHFIKTDGSIKTFDPHNKELLLRAEERKYAQPIQQKITQTIDTEELEALFRTLIIQRPKTIESLHIWVDDISFIINKLERMNRENGFFCGRLDTNRIGVLGHSFGGMAAGQACLADARCKAGINLDGLQLGDLIDNNLTRPFMFLHHDNIEVINKTPNRIFFERAENTAYMILIKGTRHLNFSDLSLPGFSDILNMPEGSLGNIDGMRCLKIQNDYILTFFDKHLKGEYSGLLDGPSEDYLEVDIMVINNKLNSK